MTEEREFTMKRSEARILTTHTGSLPRSPELQELLRSRLDPKDGEAEEFLTGVEEGVADVVAKQAAIGIDVINDGEQGRVQYATYVKDRLTGFDGEQVLRARPRKDLLDFPEFAAQSGVSSSSTAASETMSSEVPGFSPSLASCSDSRILLRRRRATGVLGSNAFSSSPTPLPFSAPSEFST